MTKSKMAQYAKGWKPPEARREDKRDAGMAKAMKGVARDNKPPPKKGC